MATYYAQWPIACDDTDYPTGAVVPDSVIKKLRGETKDQCIGTTNPLAASKSKQAAAPKPKKRNRKNKEK